MNELLQNLKSEIGEDMATLLEDVVEVGADENKLHWLQIFLSVIKSDKTTSLWYDLSKKDR